MGAYRDDAHRLSRCYWLLIFVATFVFIPHYYGCYVSAESKVDSDLVFESVDQTNYKSDDNHHRIARSLEEDDGEYWLTHTVGRLKRSLTNLFTKRDADVASKPDKHLGKANRKNRQIGQIQQEEENDQQLAEDEYDDEDDGEWYDPSSGSSGSEPIDEPEPVDTHPEYYRITLGVTEPYQVEYDDRNSLVFKKMAEHLTEALSQVYSNTPGEQTVTIIKIGKREEDSFTILVEADLETKGFYNEAKLRQDLKDHVDDHQRLGSYALIPQEFKFKKFIASENYCNSDEFKCNDGGCISNEFICNGQKDCDDGSDELSCPGTTTEAPEIETTPQQDHTDSLFNFPVFPELTVPPPIDSGSGDGDCRADDSVRCPDGSKIICADQKCDGRRDCLDGSDEHGCPTKPPQDLACRIGEFSCDLARCIPISQRCDGRYDCSDKTDEMDCCQQPNFQCDGTKCLKPDQICDGVLDCADETDERDCRRPEPETPTCSRNEFSCGDGNCIDNSWVCNGVSDCANNLDEVNCAGGCASDEFECEPNVCIPSDRVCNNFPDCQNELDEKLCGCESDEFRCGNKCVSNSKKCDGRNDCDDGFDESDCPVAACQPDQFRCNDNVTCIDQRRVCDIRRDCPDGSDELYCSCQSNEFKCIDNTCIDERRTCDGNRDCPDGSDENLPHCRPSCKYDEFTCRNGVQCIPQRDVCNGRVDCTDHSDEENCDRVDTSLNLKTYPSTQEIKENREVVFQCRDEGMERARVKWMRDNNRPLPPGSRDNNGRLEIPNIRVEHAGIYICQAVGYPPNTPGAQISVTLHVDKWSPPPPPPVPACQPHEATCANGQCIDKSLVCNDKFDCADGSDENRCNDYCEPNEFSCGNKKCVLKTWRCDGDDDCGDGSDEQNCGTTPPGSVCQYHQFTCMSNNQCVPKGYHCDNERDCIDGSDEIGCAKPVISQPPPPMVTLVAGETFQVKCTAVGVPVPEIVWRLNWGHIPSKCTYTNDNGFSILTCPDVQVTDQGAYSCEAINSKGSTFAIPDTILIVTVTSVCRPGYFNVAATQESECIKCFCFGQTTACTSADLYIYQLQPPFTILNTLGVRVDPRTSTVEIRDEPIYRGARPDVNVIDRNGVQVVLPSNVQLNQDNVYPYFAMPENYHGDQLKSYGGYLRYKVEHRNGGYPTVGPDVILSGNGYTLLYESERTPQPNTQTEMSVRFFEGDWVIRHDNGLRQTATREEIMMALADVDNILIKLLYNEGPLDTTIRNIEMDTADSRDRGLGAASYVEQCSCPAGYTGTSCEKCASGYVRSKNGPWLGQCVPRRHEECRPGEFGDPSRGIPCEPCPCPYTNPSQQFARTCSLHPDGNVVCDCQPGYMGRRCEQCAVGYTGNPLHGSPCEPEPTRNCSVGASHEDNGNCICKQFTTGPTCSQCKENAFHLSAENQHGCIRCFCSGITNQCSSSSWYRDRIFTTFHSNIQSFQLIDISRRESPINPHLSLGSNQITYNAFHPGSIYYWSLPSRYLGDKVTAYGGKLRYTLTHTPIPGGSSKNSASDVEIYANNMNLRYYSREQPNPTNQPQSFEVPLLEQYWQRTDGQPADREHLLMALSDISAIYIKATYFTNTREASLIEVSLDIAREKNTGLERAYAVEECHCPRGYKGLSCEDCDFGYTRVEEGLYFGLCEPCKCNGHSNECDPETGECKNCRDNTWGEFCELCLDGYERDSSGNCVSSRGQELCSCSHEGSLSNECVRGRCRCKSNVVGNNCDRCREGTFGLNANNADGCEACWCSGIETFCSSSSYYVEQIPSQIIDSSTHGFRLTDQTMTQHIDSNFLLNSSINQIGYRFNPSDRTTWYWALPAIFTGNQIRSYGGKLEFTQEYRERPGSGYYEDRDIIINGRGLTLYWSNPRIHQGRVSVTLAPESNWQRIDHYRPTPASREDILTVLSDVNSILIRASLASETDTSFISDITLDTAVEQVTDQGIATRVETCRCPEGYSGTSCESCASGFYRDTNDYSVRTFGSCKRCPCNNNEQSCNLGTDGRVECHCKPGYTGYNCQSTDGPETPPPYTVRPDPLPPTIEVTITTPEIDIYEVGSTVRYNCSARSLQSPRTVKIQWSKDYGSLPDRAIDDGHGMLIIDNLRESDSGTYTCEAQDGYSVMLKHVNLNVGVSNGRPPVTDVHNKFVKVTKGQMIRVTCVSQGYPIPDIRIERVDNGRLGRYTFENGEFRIQEAELSDEGTYRCIGSNRLGETESQFKIQVQDVPGRFAQVTIEPSSFNGQRGDTVVLRCRSDDGSQQVRWFKENGRLPYNSREDGDQLIIMNASPEDSGIYTCKITTYSGISGSQSVNVYISQGPMQGQFPTASVQPERVTVYQGETISLDCRTTGVPAPIVKWSKLNDQFGPGTEQIGSTLYIRNSRVQDMGTYMCTATNDMGLSQAYSLVEINRLEVPVISIYPTSTVIINEGNSYTIQCSITAGIPTPEVTWSRNDGQPLSSNLEQMQGGTLRFTQTTVRDAGDYVCNARNEAGQASATAHVTVYTVPEVQVYPSEEIVKRYVNDQLVLQCTGYGTPKPSVSWHKQSDYPYSLSSAESAGSNTAVQEFNRLRTEDAGTYVCTARSAGGQTQKIVRLVVDEKPARGDITGEDATIGSPDIPWKQLPTYSEKFTAPVGTKAELICRVNNKDDNVKVTWVRSDNSSLPSQAFIKNDVLYIDRVELANAGEYKCIGTNPWTGQILFSINTFLEVTAPALSINLSPPSQVVRPGQDASIQCTAVGEQPIQVFWTPVNRSMPASVTTRDGYIQFSRIQFNDAGTYMCTARNRLGEAHSVADVKVVDNTQKLITAQKRQVETMIGTTTTIRCLTQEVNAPINWYREHMDLPANSRQSGGNLVIYNVQPEDGGRYFCEVFTQGTSTSDYTDLVVNKQGITCKENQYVCGTRECVPRSAVCDSRRDCRDNSDEEFCYIRTRRGPAVVNAPVPELFVTPTEETYRTGDTVEFNCQSSEPGVITTWSKADGRFASNVQSHGGSLRIYNVHRDNSGLYRCEATGHQGPYHKDQYLNVIDEHRDEPVIETKTAPRGSSIILECKPNFQGPISYLWTKQNGNLPSDVDIYNRSITIYDVSSADAGTYLCSASSGNRNTQKPIKLSVTGIVPYFTQAPNSYIALPTLNDAFVQFTIEISFKPENGQGIILYNGQRYGDFISLTLVNGVPEFKYNLGYSTTTVRAERPVENQQWHNVKIIRNKRKVSMYVDGLGPYIGNAEGKVLGLDLVENLFLGGVPSPNSINPEVGMSAGFVGCISLFKIGQTHVDILKEAIDKVGVTSCETCAENKCQNQGMCQEDLTKEGYICICPKEFSGPVCNKPKGEACSPYACGSGRCIDNERSFECMCPLGYAGQRCEREIKIIEPAFRKGSYIAYPPTKLNRRLKFTLKIKPKTLDDGLLLYTAETEEGHGEFLSLAIKDRHLEMRYDAGNGPTVIRQKEELVPNQWAVLTASRTPYEGRLVVNGATPVIEKTQNRKVLNLLTPVYVGGYDKSRMRLNEGTGVETGFEGCISQISLSGMNLNLIQSANDSSNVEQCTEGDDFDNNLYPSNTNFDQTGCSSNPCLHGDCYPLSPIDYRCSCRQGYSGKNCDVPENTCANSPCKNGGSCRETSTSFVCDCPLGYTGNHCEQTIILKNDVSFDGTGYLEFNKDLLQNEDGIDEQVIALELTTNRSTGLIFWFGQRPNEDGQGQDYVSLAIINGYLEYSYDLGQGPAIIRNERVRVDDGNRHTVILKRLGKHGIMDVDHGSSDEGDSEGLTSTLNAEGNIYLGGTPNIALMTANRLSTGFSGCIHGFELQDTKTIDLGERAINGVNAKPCMSNGGNIQENDLIH